VTTTEKPRVERIIMPGWIRHGYGTNPNSRAYWCAENHAGCGPIESEPQSVEAPKGFPRSGPPDGQLASGGHVRFGSLDKVTAPDGSPWPATTLTVGARVRMRWWLTAVHKTESWEYWITRDGWDRTQPLTRAQLEPAPFSRITWPCPDGGWTCRLPAEDVHHWIWLPPGKEGEHVIYGIWNVGDTGNAFYTTMDVRIVHPAAAPAR